jgi:hypothetical protein
MTQWSELHANRSLSRGEGQTGAPERSSAASTRASDMSRCRAPCASAKRHAIRLRKHDRCGPASRASAATEVIRTSGSPHGTIQSNGSSELSTFTAKPCLETPCLGDVQADRGELAVLDPHARPRDPLLRAPAGRDALVGEGGGDGPLERRDVLHDVPDADDRIADELAGAVVGDLAAAVDVDDVDALRAVPVLAHAELAGGRAPPAGVDRLVLEEQERVRDRAGLARGAQAFLEIVRRAVLHDAEVDGPQLAGHPPDDARRPWARRRPCTRPARGCLIGPPPSTQEALPWPRPSGPPAPSTTF